MLDSEGKGKAVRFIVRSLHLMTQPFPTDELCGFSLFFLLSIVVYSVWPSTFLLQVS